MMRLPKILNNFFFHKPKMEGTMDVLFLLCQLQDKIGYRQFKVLLDPNNTEKVRRFCIELLKSEIEQRIKIGDRTYEILVSQGGYHGLKKLSEETQANIKREDYEFILKHAKDIPTILCDKVIFIFPGSYVGLKEMETVNVIEGSCGEKIHWYGSTRSIYNLSHEEERGRIFFCVLRQIV